MATGSALAAAITAATISFRNSRPTPKACIESLPFCGNMASRPSSLESSGVYWIPLYELLEANGFEVLLVDPGYTKQVKGRPKTDWPIASGSTRLASVGLPAGAFRPDEKTCQLRSYLRWRANLIRYAGQHIQHMQKALEQMNLKLTEVVSDITGVTGRAIIQAILKGTARIRTSWPNYATGGARPVKPRSPRR